MERLIVKKFGPLTHADIEIRDVNIFIGPTGSGKSTLAKLVAIFHKRVFAFTKRTPNFYSQLIRFNIYAYLSKNTFIRYEWGGGKYFWEFSKGNIETNFPFSDFRQGDFLFTSLGVNGPAVISRRFEHTLSKLENIDLSSLQDDKVKRAIQEVLLEGKSYLKKHKGSDGQTLQWTEEAGLFMELGRQLRKAMTPHLGNGHSIYIPAERIFYSIFSETLNAILSQDSEDESKLPIPKYLNDFANEMSLTKFRGVSDFSIDEMDMHFTEEDDKILYRYDGKKGIEVSAAASGIQAVMPVAKIFAARISLSSLMYVLEEPELNLFPADQDKFVKHIIGRCNKSKRRLIITTHSPYVLTSIDNLINADNVFKERPESKKKAMAIVGEKYWLSYEDVSAYFFNPNAKEGKYNTEFIMNKERKGIAGNAIDSVSDVLSIQYEKLNELRFK